MGGVEKGNLIPKAKSRMYGMLLMGQRFLETHSFSTDSIKLVFLFLMFYHALDGLKSKLTFLNINISLLTFLKHVPCPIV